MPDIGFKQFGNVDAASAHGAEIEYERGWSGGTRVRASYAWQRAQDRGTIDAPLSSPRHLVKANAALPLAAGWTLGVESRFVGRRATRLGNVSGYAVQNLTLSTQALLPGVEVSATVLNLFDRAYADPAGQEHYQDALGQDGRALRLNLRYGF
jgi:iron complex outermembrane receptor protein